MKVAVVGATGAVGRTMLQLLADRLDEVDGIVPMASERSAGASLRWRDREWTVRTPTDDAFSGCPLALFSAGGTVSAEWAPRAVAAGAVVVDNSSAWRQDPDVPLVVPEVNGHRIDHRPKGIVANPNCSTIQLVAPLAGLRARVGLAGVTVSTYQSVSGAGQSGINAWLAERSGRTPSSSPFPAAIDGNVIPRIGAMGEDGWTREEAKMRAETRKILGLPELPVVATCVRVPVEVGHAVVVRVELDEPLGLDRATAAIAAVPGVRVQDPAGGDPLPREVAGSDEIVVGRLRRDPDRANVLHMWIVADNLRKGAATNAVQIGEAVLRG
ncbi:MAG: aspartate-semialdehyde dehydrogenase [Longimicrobiales bacterium]